MTDGKPWSKTDHKKIEIENLITHESWWKYLEVYTLRTIWGGKTECRENKAGPGTDACVRAHGWNTLRFPG